MRPKPDTLKLPSKLIDELGGKDVLSRKRKDAGGIVARKDRRKAERDGKKLHTVHSPSTKRARQEKHHDSRAASARSPAKNLDEIVQTPKLKSILRAVKQPQKIIPVRATLPSPPPNYTSRATQDKLAQDDAEIAFLEKKLGMKKKKVLPKAFEDDGLDDLLEGLGGDSDGSVQELRKRKAEEDDWLAKKRRKAKSLQQDEEDSGASDLEENGGASDISMDDDRHLNDSEVDDGSPDLEFEDFDGFDSDIPEPLVQKRVRENPYVAPPTFDTLTTAKYIPPSLRNRSSSESEDLVRLRRQIQGLVNRLTEANLISILGDIEKLYRSNPRQNVTSTLVELLLTSVCEPTTLPDTLIILPAGFIAAVYKTVGTDFGAQVVQRLVELFDGHYVHAMASGNSGPEAATSDRSKETSNLITVLCELYNFQVVGSNLIFDYIRLFLKSLSELNAELLLKIIRTSGPQLRQDDPSSLKDIVNMLRPAVANVGEANLSVRTKFMIETINDLKNNKMKTGAAASAVISEHTIRMKKTLGSLNTRSIKASEPLRIGLRDIQESEKRGKWWLVGASWAGNANEEDEDSQPSSTKIEKSQVIIDNDDGPTDFVQLALEQRMNTDIRRAIFITIMSGSDYQDAHVHLLKLQLKKSQELEIPKVLIHCAGAEKNYNPYYTLISKKLCGDRKLKMAFQFSLWDLFKRMGEGEGDVDVEEDQDDSLDMRSIVNLAKMFGVLIADGALGLPVLKNLSLSYLQPRTKTFVEVMFICTFLHAGATREEAKVVGVISKVREVPSLVRGMLYFITKVVAKTDVAGGKAEKATVRWASKVAAETLEAMVVVDSTKRSV